MVEYYRELRRLSTRWLTAPRSAQRLTADPDDRAEMRAAAPAFAWEEEENSTKVHCNSGNGNGSDPITFVAGEHCYGGDPGNAYNAGDKGRRRDSY
jgi:hypothetical protein